MQEESNKTKKGLNPSTIVMGLLAEVFIGFIIFAPAGDVRSPLALNSPAPQFELRDTDDRLWRLSELKGSVVVINFWATWCPPCREEMPSLWNLFKNTMDRQDITIITILYGDTPAAAQAYFRDSGFQMPVLVDPGARAADMYGVTGVPETFVIDHKGLLRKHVIGPVDFDDPAAVGYLKGLLAGN